MKNSDANPKSPREPGKPPPKPQKLIKPAEAVKYWHKTPKATEKLK
jgi:hypothetical protein